MKIAVKVKPSAREDKVETPTPKLLSAGDELEIYTVWVKALPKKGKANDATIKLLADHFKVSYSQVRLVSGVTGRRKIFEIRD
ncbi:MAG: DUF167 domain-containing protein [Candidatus Vogelbacteria bacterium]|nr:DUF167 domain-containing protein [Candidatus Vogelbacteria bacterium]